MGCTAPAWARAPRTQAASRSAEVWASFGRREASVLGSRHHSEEQGKPQAGASGSKGKVAESLGRTAEDSAQAVGGGH